MLLSCIFLAECRPDCQNEGVCSAPNTCDCIDTGYMGDQCQTHMFKKNSLFSHYGFLFCLKYTVSPINNEFCFL